TGYLGLRIALHDQKQLVGAVAAHQKALEIDPKFGKAYKNLGEVLILLGRFAEAKAVGQKALASLDPKDPWRSMLASMLQHCEHLETLDATESLSPVEDRALREGLKGKLDTYASLDIFFQTLKSHRKSHAARLKGGQSYQIDLAGDFDTLVRVEDGVFQTLLF